MREREILAEQSELAIVALIVISQESRMRALSLSLLPAVPADLSAFLLIKAQNNAT